MRVTRVTTLATVGFGPGAVLLLGDEQVAPRRHALQSLGGKRYRVTARVEFKAGERMGVEGDIPKGLLDRFDLSAARPVEQKPAAGG